MGRQLWRQIPLFRVFLSGELTVFLLTFCLMQDLGGGMDMFGGDEDY